MLPNKKIMIAKNHQLHKKNPNMSLNKKMLKMKRKYKSQKEITSNHCYNNKRCLMMKTQKRTNNEKEVAKEDEVVKEDTNVDITLKRIWTIKILTTRVETQTKTDNMETQPIKLSEEERSTKPSTDVN